MNQERIKELLEKYSLGECSEHERKVIEDWYNQLSYEEETGFTEPNYKIHSSIVWSKIIQKRKDLKSKRKFRYPLLAVAASILLGIALFSYLHFQESSSIEAKVVPGDNRASLYLSDGTAIPLEELDEEWNTRDLGVRIKKLDGGLIAYEVLDDSTESSIGKYHTIKTPNGGQYQILLPDGTKVWLNANSTLRYPIKFDKRIREIELTGEAYFEVNKQAAEDSRKPIPFYVHSKQQRVEVLGTHFNISAYEDELQVKTTLIEGSVRVAAVHSTDLKQSQLLNQIGQQTILENSNIQLTQVNVEHVIDWKNGYFVFNNEDLYSILRKVARWYDVEVEFSQQVSTLELNGAISKYENIDTVLSVIEFASGIKLKMKGRRIIIMH